MSENNDLNINSKNNLLDSLEPKPNRSDSPPSKRKWGKRATFLIGLILLAGVIGVGSYAGFFYSKTMKTANNIFVGKGNNSNANNFDFGDLFNNVINRDKREPLLGESDGRTNYLLIGKDYDNNTDTLIVLSYYYKEKQIVTMNLPRDLRVFDGFETSKINAIYANASSRYQNQNSDIIPEEYLTNFVAQELAIPIQYWVRVDIAGVTKLIDELGGIEINVDNAFTDCEYPTSDYRPVYYKDLGQSLPYIRPCPHFEPGKQIVDAKTALIYSRSRKSYDNPAEAIDFARSKRQSKVIEGILAKLKAKLNDGTFILDVNHIDSLFSILGDNVKTSTTVDNALSFVKLLKQNPPNNQIQRFSLDYDSGLICDTPGSSDIMLCDGAILGQKKQSITREKLRQVAQNLIDQTQLEVLFDSTVTIIGNGSDVIPRVQNSLLNLGFKPGNLLINSNFNLIKPATLNSVEKAYIYIPDPQVREMYNKVKSNLTKSQPSRSTALTNSSNFDSTVIDVTQSKYILPKGLENSKIVIIIE